MHAFRQKDTSMDKRQMNVNAHFLALVSVIVLHFKPQLLTPSIVAISLFAITTVLHLFKELDKVHVDAKNQTLDIEDERSENNEKK